MTIATDKHRERQRRYRERHRDKINFRALAHREVNRENQREYWAQWRKRNRDKVNAQSLASHHRTKVLKIKRTDEEKRRMRANYEAARRARKKTSSIDLVYIDEWTQILVGDPCCFCGNRIDPTVDHIVPLVKSGPHIWSNMTSACLSCNSSKNDSNLLDWMGTNGK